MLHGARRTARTIIQMTVGVAAMAVPIYEAATHKDAALATGWAASAIMISAVITRVMALPAVETFLQRWLPPLAATRPEYAVPVDEEDHEPSVINEELLATEDVDHPVTSSGTDVVNDGPVINSPPADLT